MAKRFKTIPVHEFEPIMNHEWSPMKLYGGAVPQLLNGIPRDRLHSIVASGTHLSGTSYSDHVISSGERIGGIDVYRYSPDDPVDLNKDWYAILKSSSDDKIVFVSGPIRDNQHWLNFDQISSRVKNAAILALPKAEN